MKSTGIVRNVDELGRIVLPKELRKVWDMEPGTPLEIFRNGNQIILQKYRHACTLCGKTEPRVALHTVCGRLICEECADRLRAELR